MQFSVESPGPEDVRPWSTEVSGRKGLRGAGLQVGLGEAAPESQAVRAIGWHAHVWARRWHLAASLAGLRWRLAALLAIEQPHILRELGSGSMLPSEGPP